MRYYIQFVANSSAWDKLMPIMSPNLSKQMAVDIARNMYGESVFNVLSENEIDGNWSKIDFGSTVIFTEYDREQKPKRVLSYPQGKLTGEPLSSVINWFKIIDNLSDVENRNKNISVQVACHIEETIEFLTTLTRFDNEQKDIANSILELYKVNHLFKDVENNNFNFLSLLNKEKKLEILDSLCDMIITAIGVGYRMGFDMLGAMSEVNRSNWSKFENGKVLKDENGKVIKGRDYFKPNLEPFLGENK